ncbi:urease accessory protein UreF [Oceaniglobus trochenteri]|uniref:urease accessory protein UreF n=1 Tax=Oceaniglobus trochenteri TaxID=2763260 RepID=UPI001CFFC87F|nr:urease accessory UreF family protein [Oceaniglobus trochenteri]
MTTPTDPGILTLAQWLSPSYPVGSFAYSHGLEAAVNRGEVVDADSLASWLRDVLQAGAGRFDALCLAAACRADTRARVHEIDQTARAFAPSVERLRETDLQGAAFCDVTRAVWGLDLHALTFPVAVGRAIGLAGLDQVTGSLMYLQAFISNLAAAAQRLLPLGQTDAQRLIHDLAPLCREIGQTTADGDLNDLSGTAFLTDIASMHHETQYSRIFRT